MYRGNEREKNTRKFPRTEDAYFHTKVSTKCKAQQKTHAKEILEHWEGIVNSSRERKRSHNKGIRMPSDFSTAELEARKTQHQHQKSKENESKFRILGPTKFTNRVQEQRICSHTPEMVVLNPALIQKYKHKKLLFQKNVL